MAQKEETVSSSSPSSLPPDRLQPPTPICQVRRRLDRLASTTQISLAALSNLVERSLICTCSRPRVAALVRVQAHPLSLLLRPTPPCVFPYPAMPSPSLPPDKILISDLSLPITIANDHWSRSLPQPHVLNLTIIHPTAVSASTDTLPTTINYSTATKAVTKHVQERTWASLEECAEETATVLRELGAGRVGVQIAATKVLAGGWVELGIWRGGSGQEKDSFKMREIPVRCIIGINPQERLEKQTVVVDLEAPLPAAPPLATLASSTGFPHKILSDAVHDVSVAISSAVPLKQS